MFVKLTNEMKEKYPGILGVEVNYMDGGSSLGCHTRLLTGTSVTCYGRNPYVDSKCTGRDQWGNQRATENIVPILDSFQDSGDMYELLYSMLVPHFGDVTNVIMSDNVGRPCKSSSEWGLNGVASFVEFLVEKKGWGCTAGAICSNHNYHNSSNPHLVQTFILYPPKVLGNGWVTADTSFITKNVTENKTRLRDLLKVFWKMMGKSQATWADFKGQNLELSNCSPRYFRTIYDYDSLMEEPAPIPPPVKVKPEVIQQVKYGPRPSRGVSLKLGTRVLKNKVYKPRNY